MPPTEEGKTHFISPRLLQKLDYQTPLSKFYAEATYMSRRTEPESLDFTVGDAHEMPPPGFVEALQRWSYRKIPIGMAIREIFHNHGLLYPLL
ncbi:MAG: hypothetical protein PUP93_05300 [Rhizonema sp. NSF051]|nr:hypothetical protein [Rhizonema sp. NSF051]